MSATKTVAVAGAGATNVVATVAVNLAVALAKLGIRVELHDGDTDAPAARALTGAPPERTSATTSRVTLRRGEPLEIPAADPAPEGLAANAAPEIVVTSRTSASGDVAVDASVRLADAVIVPVDGSANSLAALDAVAAASSGGRAPIVLLSRTMSRGVDRWALVDQLNDRDDARLLASTVPMGGGARGRGADSAERATLYAPTTAAARAYGVVARDLLVALGVAALQPD